jgi:AmiR/NasT family two-component response regulator
MNTLDTMHA